MKYKYTFLKNRLFYDEILIPYLDKMSKKGWNLVSVNSFFKFEKSSQVYKYQVDYNPLTDDYLETLDHLMETLAFFEAECYTNEADGDQQEKISKSMRGSAW